MKPSWSLLAGLILFLGLQRPLQADLILYSNTTPIEIPESGLANPYPSTIHVNGVVGPVTEIRVTLSQITHTFVDDLAAVVVGPEGSATLLFSGPGPDVSESGAHGVSNQTWTFTDAAAQQLPMSSTPSSGTYRPGLSEYGDIFPSPGPGGIYDQDFFAFLSDNPNGAWRLFLMDGNDGDKGLVAGGWSIAFQASPLSTAAVPEPSPALGFGIAALVWGACKLRRLVSPRFFGSIMAQHKANVER